MDKEKAVAVTLDGKILFQCDTITQAEEWLVEDPSVDQVRLAAGDYGIDPTEEAEAEYQRQGRGEETPTPEDEPENHIKLMAAIIGKLTDRLNELRSSEDDAKLIDDAEEVLRQVDADHEHLFVKAYDEMVTEGRINLLEYLDRNIQEHTVNLEAFFNVMTRNQTPEIPKRRPMLIADALRAMRSKARNMSHAVLVAPVHFAIPGLRDLALEMEAAITTPVIEEYRESYGEEIVAEMLPHISTYDDFMHGNRTITRQDD